MKKLYTLLVLLFAISTANSQIVNIPDVNFKAKLLGASSTTGIAKNQAGVNVAIDTNGDGQIQVSEASLIYQLMINGPTSITSLLGIENFTNLTVLSTSNTSITSLDVTALTNLTNLSCTSSTLSNLNASGLTNLTYLNCPNNQLTMLNVSGDTALVTLLCNGNQINQLDLTGMSQLEEFYAYSNQLTSLINLSHCSSLEYLEVYTNLLGSLDVSGCPLLISLDCYNNSITSLDLSNNPNLLFVECQNNLLSSLNVQDCAQLLTLKASVNLLTTLDISETRISQLYVDSNQLTSLYIKNGRFETPLYLFNNPNLAYICCDENQLVSIRNSIVSAGIPNCEVNTYCTLVPGGNFSTIQGNNRFDFNGDGCDVNDVNDEFMRLNITSGSVTSTIFSNPSGLYTVYLPQGTYTIAPQLENPSYYTIFPSNFSATVPLAVSPLQQDFCLSANGSHQDLEVVIVPLIPARPGFNATYKIIYRNKGTITLSGNVALTFEDSKIDFVLANPMPTTQNFGSFTWDYNNLQPFETRQIALTMNINSPMEIPAVNIGDQLDFIANIYPLQNDEYPLDNESGLKQIVVGSFDPNDKTCVEGTSITPSMVGQYVHYVIRFENTGTFAAENVVIKDMIDVTKFDMTTLVPLYGSHPFVTRMINTNQLEFIFENINLPFDDANNDGYVAFKIKTKPTLVIGNSFSNSASIYFDYNFPIITDTYTTTIQALSNQDFEFNSVFSLSPVPTKNVLTITAKESVVMTSVSIYNTLGQLVQVNTNPTETIDVSGLQSGSYFIKIISDKGNATGKFIKE
ncbi:T9SS type A sorting domain-containing protein [Flavobacterium sp.]|uniref:DUF7619 domain-containing protein n=1 Tax=Flavobacterium sp. TaxID=239 RepID=UPI00391BCEAA